jgi:hypothetical protein
LFLRAGLFRQAIALAVGIGAWVWIGTHLAATKYYLGAATPKVIIDKVEPGSTVLKKITDTQVVFIDVPLHGASHVIGTFPRGEGLEHLGAAQSLSDTVLRYIYPWGPVVLVGLAVLAIIRTLVVHRLYPSAATVLVSHRDRKPTQFLVHKLDLWPKDLSMLRVADGDSGNTLLEWATRHGGGQAVAGIDTLVSLNRYRRQPGIGSVSTASTRLKAGWTIVVPKVFGTVIPEGAHGAWEDAVPPETPHRRP